MSALEDMYRAKQRGLLDRLKVRLTDVYSATIDPNDLDASFPRLFARAAPMIRAGQSAGVSLSTAYLSALVLRDAGRTARLPIRPDLVGTSKVGTLEQGMDAWPSMVKAQIGQGRDRAEAVAYGAFLMNRFAAAETTRAIDEQTEYATQAGKFRGWVGILSPTACEACQAENAGFHPLTDQPLRHGGCGCTQQYVVI